MSRQDPTHVGIIMDGNRRWAKRHGVSDIKGHEAGYKRIKELLSAIRQTNITHISVYSFSTENWQRPEREVKALFKLFEWALTEELEEAIKKGLRIIINGSPEGLSDEMKKKFIQAEKKTAEGDRVMAICFNYGGKQEIADAAESVRQAGEAITPETINAHLYHPELPPLDLVIRTGGEKRLSNFMLWQAAYAELVFSDTLWPDFSNEEFLQIIKEYRQRERRFGA